ncbi:hypothetical protein ScPMuIL_003318 [Solemya velum]
MARRAAVYQPPQLPPVQSLTTTVGRQLRSKGQPENWLVGEAGVGKSSLENTIACVCENRWYPQARVGRSGAGLPKTGNVTWYYNCNTSDNCRNLPKDLLPNIIDMPGYAGHNFGKWKKILTAIIDGRVIDRTNVTHLLGELERYPNHLDSLRVDKSRCISKIIFVASVTDNINEELVQLVKDVAAPQDGRNRVIPVYGALTHCDLIGQPHGVTPREADHRRSDMIQKLDIGGAANDYFSDIHNFSDELTAPNNNVSAITLNFLRMVLVQNPWDEEDNPNHLTLCARTKRLVNPVYLLAFICLVLALVLAVPYALDARDMFWKSDVTNSDTTSGRTKGVPGTKSDTASGDTQNVPKTNSDKTSGGTQGVPGTKSDTTPGGTQDVPKTNSDTTPGDTQNVPKTNSDTTSGGTQGVPKTNSDTTSGDTQGVPGTNSDTTSSDRKGVPRRKRDTTFFPETKSVIYL